MTAKKRPARPARGTYGRCREPSGLGRPVLALSAVTGQGLADLVRAAVEQLHKREQAGYNSSAQPENRSE